MTLLYYFETSLDYHGMTSKELYKLWLKHAESAFKLYDQGIMKYAFKVGQSDIWIFAQYELLKRKCSVYIFSDREMSG